MKMKFIEKIKNNKFLKGASLVLKGITSIVIIFVICIIFIQRISNNKVTLGGISMYTVVSESMKPKYEIYDMLIAKKVYPSTIKVGDDVVYMGEKSTLKDKIVTHQVIKKDYKKGYILPVCIFILMMVMLFYGVNSVTNATAQKEQESLKNAVVQSAVHCYSVEGAYPDSLDYLKKHYGITWDESKYKVTYEIIAKNIRPEVKVIPLQESKK